MILLIQNHLLFFPLISMTAAKSKIIKKTLNYEATIKELLLEKYFTNVIWAKMYKKEIF